MYEVKLINSDEEIIINTVSTLQTAPRITGTIKQGINCFNSFTFFIYPGNPGYEKIYPYKSKITVYNTIKGKYEFIGRVLTLTASMDEEGVACKEYVCESELAYLCDSQQRYKEYHNCTPKQYLEALIAVHNANIEPSKQFVVGNVTVTDPNDSIYRYSDYKSTWENIKEDLLNALGGEIQVRYDGDVRYLDYLASPGETCTTKIKLGHNMKSISEKLDIDGLYTRIIPLGAKLKTTDENGNEVETDERLTIASVNNGIDYLDYQDGINQYGIIQGTVVWDDVTTASELFKKAQEYINSLTISLSNEITAYDLSLIGLDIDSFEVGNYYPVENELLNINYTLRVIEKTINIENPAESTLTFGKQAIDIKTYNALKQQETKKKLESTLQKLKEIQNNIRVIADEKINAYDEVLNQTALLQKLVDGDYDGLYLDENGRLFIKGTYVTTGILASVQLVTGSNTEPVSWINLDDGTFSFAGGKIKYDGTAGTIAGFKIDSTSLSCDIVEDYSGLTVDDRNRVQQIIIGNITPTDEDYERLDVDDSYHIGATDMLRIQQILTGTIDNSVTGRMSINLNSAKDSIVIEGLTGFKAGWKTRIGVGGISTKTVKADNFLCGDSEMSDFVVEQGTDGNWIYRKWYSGIAECWGTFYHATDINSSWGSVYESPAFYETFPIGLFTGVTICNITGRTADVGILSVETSKGLNETRTQTYYFTRATSQTSVGCFADIRVIGVWK